MIPEKWGVLRPEQLKPAQFIELTLDLFGPRGSAESNAAMQRTHQAAALHREITSNQMTGKAAQRIKDQVALLYDDDHRMKMMMAEEKGEENESQEDNDNALESSTKKVLAATQVEEKDHQQESGTGLPDQELTIQAEQDAQGSRSTRGRLLRPSVLSRRALRRNAQVAGDSSGPSSSPTGGKNTNTRANVNEDEDIDAILAAVNRDPVEAYVKKSNAAKKAEKFGSIQPEVVAKAGTSAESATPVARKADKSQYVSDAVWRRAFSNFNI